MEQEKQQCQASNFQDAIRHVQDGAYSEGSPLSAEYARDPSLQAVGRLLAKAVRMDRGQPLLPPPSLLPPLP